MSETWRCSASTRRRSTASLQHGVDVDDLGIAERVVGLQPGQLDDLADQIGEPGRLDAHPGGEAADRVGILGGVLYGLGQQRDGADRGLQLVADIGHEVAAGLFDPPGSGLVVGQHDDQIFVQRSNPDGEVGRGRLGSARELQLDGAQGVVAAYGADQLEQFGNGDPGAADQSKGSRTRRGVEDLVMGADDDRRRAEDGQHLGHPVGDDRASVSKGSSRLPGVRRTRARSRCRPQRRPPGRWPRTGPDSHEE